MIPRYWLLMVLFGGVFLGLFIMALCVVAGRGSDE